MDLVVEAMLKLYGLESPEQVRDALRDNNLTATLSRVNARGVLRSTDAGPQVFIGLIEESPLDAVVSGKAHQEHAWALRNGERCRSCCASGSSA